MTCPFLESGLKLGPMYWVKINDQTINDQTILPILRNFGEIYDKSANNVGDFCQHFLANCSIGTKYDRFTYQFLGLTKVIHSFIYQRGENGTIFMARP